MKLTRRDCLRLTSGATMALPLLDAFAAPSDVPLRLVIYATPEGTLPSLFTPPVLANDALRLSPMLQPLAPHQNKLCVVTGVSNKIADLHPAADGHTKTGKTLLSATVIASSADGLTYDANRMPTYGQRCLGPSIDHALAAKLGIAEPVNLAVGVADPGENTMFYRASGTGPRPIAPLVIDPRVAFSTYLSTNTAPPTTRLDRFLARRSATLTAAAGDFSRLDRRMSASDRTRLDEHAEALRSLERRLRAPPTVSCTPGSAPTGYTLPTSANGFLGADGTSRTMIDVMVRILACGDRRVVALQDTLLDSPPWEFLPSGGITSWHVKIHDNYTGANPLPLQESFLYFAQNFERLLSQMDSVMEPNGKTLLDNSLVLWLSEFGTGSTHDANNLPVVIAGGAQGRIALNRHLSRPGATTNDLFTSVLQAFGLPDTAFGFDSASLNHGGVSGLLT